MMRDRDDLKYAAYHALYSRGYLVGRLEITSACGQRCMLCQSWREHRTAVYSGRWSLKELNELWDELNGMDSFRVLTLTGGDPMSHSDLGRILERPRNFKVFVSTALPNTNRAVPPGVLRRADRLRISLDAATPDTYHKLRGVRRDPAEVIRLMDDELAEFMDIDVLMTINEHNVHEVHMLAVMLADQLKNRIRKFMFLIGVGKPPPNQMLSILKEQFELLQRADLPFETSTQESPLEVLEARNSEEALEYPCAVGWMGFHLKCNKVIMPCCLVGGEAKGTEDQFGLGVWEKRGDLAAALNLAHEHPLLHHPYRSPSCRAACQYKQLMMNRYAAEAAKVFFSMP